MSKYKTGDKFVIEIGAERLGDPILYRIKGFNTLVFDDNGLDKLERYDADAKANADYNSGYEDGLRDAWECEKRIYDMTGKERKECFCRDSLYQLMTELTASEAIAKLKEYEAKQAEIKVGDEIINEGDKGVVTCVNRDVCDVIWFDGSVNEAFEKRNLRKTGRHYDIDSILEQLKGADDE